MDTIAELDLDAAILLSVILAFDSWMEAALADALGWAPDRTEPALAELTRCGLVQRQDGAVAPTPAARRCGRMMVVG